MGIRSKKKIAVFSPRYSRLHLAPAWETHLTHFKRVSSPLGQRLFNTCKKIHKCMSFYDTSGCGNKSERNFGHMEIFFVFNGFLMVYVLNLIYFLPSMHVGSEGPFNWQNNFTP